MIENIKDAKEQLIDCFGGKKELEEAIENNIQDTIIELADSNVDVYTSALLEWAKDNYSDIEDAIEEFGFAKNQEGKPDFIKAIMSGQYLVNNRLLYEAWEELKEE